MRILSLLSFTVFVSMSCTCLAQIDLKKVETGVSRAVFGRLFGNKLVFENINQNDPLGKHEIFLKNIENLKENILMEKTYDSPIGWVDSHTVLIVGYPNIYLYDINSQKIISKIKDESISKYDVQVVNDGDILISFPNSLEVKEKKSFKLNLNTGEKEIIKELSGKSIGRVAYNRTNDIIAFTWFNRKNRLDVLSILNSDNLINITEFNADIEIPLIFSEDGQVLYFVVSENEISKLYKLQLANRKTTNLYTFKKGIECVDLSYSNNRLLLTLVGSGASDEGMFYSRDSTYNYEIELEIKPVGLYLIENL